MGGTRVKALVLLCLIVFCAVSVNGKNLKKVKNEHRSPPGTGHGGGSTYGQNGNYTGFGLKFNYYEKTCPQAESLVTAEVKKAYAPDPTIVGGLIRLFFHDCFVRGCDGSVLLDGIDAEKVGAPNANSLRGFDVIDNAKAAIEKVCPGVVSCADIVAYAARDSIVLGKGFVPFGLWLGGRKDGSVSISAETLVNLPAPFFGYDQLKAAFLAKGLTEVEMVILSAAHTVGKAHCGAFLNRLYNFQSTGLPDPTIDPTYLPTLQTLCPIGFPGNEVKMDMATPAIVDINYVTDVLRGRGLFTSDNALRTTANGTAILKNIANNFVFQPAFVLAMLKMGTIGIKTGSAGNIRVNCRTTVGAKP